MVIEVYVSLTQLICNSERSEIFLRVVSKEYRLLRMQTVTGLPTVQTRTLLKIGPLT